ncbi:MAG: fatty-acid--CoA ligase FadD5 [Candidatus Dormibacteraceae bacterium]
MHLGEAVSAGAHLFPDKVGARDLSRSLTYRQWNQRACRLSNALLGLGLVTGDRVAVLAYNCVEWLEIYAATAKAGLVAVPVNFRLVAPEIRYILQDAGVRAVIVQAELVDRVEEIRADLADLAPAYIHFGREIGPAGFHSYEALLAAGAADEPGPELAPSDAWTIMYTSGTTGSPKGAVQSHHSAAAIALVTDLDFGFTADDAALLVMPMCHANSIYFFSAFAYLGATCCVYDRKSFDPEELLRTLSTERVTFTSLVPTHYITMLGLPDAVRARHRAGDVHRLLISSASARRDTKLAILEQFPESKIFELYGSTEAGWVTLLRPDEQLTNLGSVGREFTGSARIRLLDESGEEVADGVVGELYSRTPYTFSGYWNLPEKTADAFRGDHFSAGDLARRDPEGFYHLVDRKRNMIISGGENVYPSEVENLLGAHPKVRDVAVIGLPDLTWGESVHAVVVLNAGETATQEELIDWCRGRIAGYKRPRAIDFVPEEEVPRTATGKILHRALRDRYEKAARPEAKTGP